MREKIIELIATQFAKDRSRFMHLVYTNLTQFNTPAKIHG
jgi:hypothetical protein